MSKTDVIEALREQGLVPKSLDRVFYVPKIGQLDVEDLRRHVREVVKQEVEGARWKAAFWFGMGAVTTVCGYLVVGLAVHR